MKTPSALNQQYPKTYAARSSLSYTTTDGARVTVSGLLPQGAEQVKKAQEALGSTNFTRE